MALPLGTVVNAVFKNQSWLYVQTPHGQEGYVGYAACLPLGILPPSTRGPCWEDSTDVFPRPLGKQSFPCNFQRKIKFQQTKRKITYLLQLYRYM